MSRPSIDVQGERTRNDGRPLKGHGLRKRAGLSRRMTEPEPQAVIRHEGGAGGGRRPEPRPETARGDAKPGLGTDRNDVCSLRRPGPF